MNDRYTFTEKVPDRVLEMCYVSAEDMQSVFNFIAHLKTRYKPEGRVLVEIRHVGIYTDLNGTYRVEKEARVEWGYDVTRAIPGEFLVYYPGTDELVALPHAELIKRDIKRKEQA